MKNDHPRKFSNLSNWKEEVTGSNPVEALTFQASFQLLKLGKINCDDHSSLSKTNKVYCDCNGAFHSTKNSGLSLQKIPVWNGTV